MSLIFLGQSYIACIISFAGMYLVSYLYEPYSAFVLFTWHEDVEGCVFTIWQVIVRLLYFSFSTMTSTGLGDVFPTTWYSQLMVTIQVNVCVLYHAVILGSGLSSLRPVAAIEGEAGSSGLGTGGERGTDTRSGYATVATDSGQNTRRPSSFWD